jgi:hypothetical protein
MRLFDFQIYSEAPLCLPRGWRFYATILAPLCLVLVANVIIFVTIAATIYMSHGSAAPRKTTVHGASLRQCKQLIFFFILLGLNWTFGVCQHVFPSAIFEYLLSITIGLQGLFYFIFLVLLHDKVIASISSLLSSNRNSSDSNANQRSS